MLAAYTQSFALIQFSMLCLQARTGGSTNEPHHGLVETIKENVEILVEKVQEMLPHHAAEQTGARAAPYGGSAGTAQYTSTERVSMFGCAWLWRNERTVVIELRKLYKAW